MLNAIQTYHMEKRAKKPSRREQQRLHWEKLCAYMPAPRVAVESLDELPDAARNAVELVCRTYGLSIHELTENTKKAAIVRPRHVTVHLLFKLGYGPTAIRKMLGNLPKNAPRKSLERDRYLRAVNPKLAADVELLEAILCV
jgi:hypothetical protein